MDPRLLYDVDSEDAPALYTAPTSLHTPQSGKTPQIKLLAKQHRANVKRNTSAQQKNRQESI